MFKFFRDETNRNFIRLWWAQLVSQFGDRIHQMALIGLIAERAPGSALGLAKLLAFTIIPVFIVGPLAGVYVDRWDRRRILFVCDIARGALVLTIPYAFLSQSSMLPIYAVVFLVFCFSRFYVPAKMSIIPDLVTHDNLLIANSLLTTTGMIAFVLGCALGGFLVDHFGARGGFIIDGLTFFLSALLIISIRRDLAVAIKKDEIIKQSKALLQAEKSVFLEIKEGFLYLKGHPEIRFIINMFFLLLSAAGAIYVVIIVFIQQAFQSGVKDLGVLAVALGVGLFCGTLLYGRWGKRFIWYKTIFCCLILGGILIIVFASVVNSYPNLLTALLLSFSLGLILGPIFIASNTVIHLVSDESMRGKVFTALEIVIHFAFLAAMLVSSILAEFISAFWILIGVGGIFGFLGIYGYRVYKNGSAQNNR